MNTSFIIIQEFIIVLGKKVFSELTKLIGGTSNYMITMGAEFQECLELSYDSDERAKEIYEDCKARAMKGPVGGIYLFSSDEEREDALRNYRKSPWDKKGMENPYKYQEEELVKEAISINGVVVDCSLTKMSDIEEVYYSVKIGNEEVTVIAPEEYAMESFEELKERAMKGPVNGKYIFQSDEEREDALAEGK